MKIGNLEINMFRRRELIFEFIFMKDPAPLHGFVIWLGMLGKELTIDIGNNDARRKTVGEILA